MNDEEQIAEWIQEQYKVASQVIVKPDPQPLPFVFAPSSRSNTSTHEDHYCNNNPRFVDITIATTNDYNNTINNTETNHLVNRNVTHYYYGGVDVSFPEPSDTSLPSSKSKIDNDDAAAAVAVYVILEYPSMSIVYQQYTYFHLTIPYIPSFLAFREIDPIVALIQQQQTTHPQFTPNTILVDGNGIFHPRHAGLACFVGVRTGIPTIGIGKTLYCHSESGRTKNNIHRMIYSSIQNCCSSSGGNDDGTKQNCQSSEQDTHPSELVVTFDCYIDPPKSQNNDDISRRGDDSPMSDNADIMDRTSEDRILLMKELSKKCLGLAIPIYGTMPNGIRNLRSNNMMMIENDTDDNDPTDNATDNKGLTPFLLAYALVGHGGRTTCTGRTKNRRPRPPGTTNPIYISVGHDISLQEAVLVCCQLSLSRIPEPVRQAVYMVGHCYESKQENPSQENN